MTPCESLAGRCDPVANGLQQACDSSHHPPTSTVTAIGEFGDIAKLAKTSLCERWYFPSWFGTQFAVDARNKRIFELWMACYENTEIASVCGCDEKTVRTVIGESAELPKLRKDEQASAEHATDFEVPIYNIWKQQTKSTAKTDSAFAPCRVPMAGLDECCRLACDAS